MDVKIKEWLWNLRQMISDELPGIICSHFWCCKRLVCTQWEYSCFPHRNYKRITVYLYLLFGKIVCQCRNKCPVSGNEYIWLVQLVTKKRGWKCCKDNKNHRRTKYSDYSFCHNFLCGCLVFAPVVQPCRFGICKFVCSLDRCVEYIGFSVCHDFNDR